VRLLLDTHIVLWWLADDPRLAPGIRAAVLDGSNDAFVSAVVVAEIAIKQSLGKLDAPFELVTLLSENGFQELPLTCAHSAELGRLPWLHRDPWDRMLVAQARVESLTLATVDPRIRTYDVVTLGD
jgi:PIN domain nuclease of toxin-antitoxin system